MSKLSWCKTILFVCVFCAVEAIGSPAQTFTTLLYFDETNGNSPNVPLVQGTDGSFYGTTISGGSTTGFCGDLGCGTFFKITPKGQLTTLYSFCSQTNCTDGADPDAGLVLARNGDFYGTTFEGGASSNCPLGCGTVFRVTAEGKLTTLHSFDLSDGSRPEGVLVQATNGNFYGTTAGGGANEVGTVFEITPGGRLTTLHSFDNTDGDFPEAGLVQAADGDFYGTAPIGGVSSNCPGGCGTVFKITAEGKLTTLHSFDVSDGEAPVAALIQGTNGKFYGTTEDGGVYGHYGTVFEITPEGKLTTLYSFCAQAECADGQSPTAGLVQATDGKFYGTTAGGGTYGLGTVFEITPGGEFTMLHSFDGTDGFDPYAGLLQSTNGNFYGTTSFGGTGSNCTGGCGTVFSLDVGLGPFVETLPTSGRVGEKVIILGNDLTEATRVIFHHAEARFRVVSSSEIETIVPRDAKTGKVEVTTPSGRLKSNVEFRVERGFEDEDEDSRE